LAATRISPPSAPESVRGVAQSAGLRCRWLLDKVEAALDSTEPLLDAVDAPIDPGDFELHMRQLLVEARHTDLENRGTRQ
jgi:hypothetical protein